MADIWDVDENTEIEICLIKNLDLGYEDHEIELDDINWEDVNLGDSLEEKKRDEETTVKEQQVLMCKKCQKKYKKHGYLIKHEKICKFYAFE